jgi:hypothetical protein
VQLQLFVALLHLVDLDKNLFYGLILHVLKAYHAGMDSATRTQNQDDFLMEKIDTKIFVRS